MPDNESYPSTVFEFRNTYTIQPPTAVGTDTTWNALFLSLPGPENVTLVWKWSASSTPPAADMNVVANQPVPLFNTNYNFGNWAGDVSRWRRLYGSQTFELNVSDLYNQGMVYCAQQRLEVWSEGTQLTTPNARSITWPSQQIVLTQLPTSPQTLQQMSPGFYKQLAREGCFTVSGLAQPTNLYQPGNSTLLSLGTQDNYDNSVPIFIGQRLETIEGASRIVSSGISTNWSSSWTLWTGLANQATLELKQIHGYECQAALGSSFTLFVEPSAEPDSAAVETYYRLRHGMMDAYPAKYNFLGSLLSFIPAALGKLASWLMPVAQAAAPAVGNAVGQAIAGFGKPLPDRAEISKKVMNLEEKAAPVAAPRRLTPVAAPRPSVTIQAPKRGRSRGRSRTRRAKSAA
jgi:hypothetical protein